MPKHIIYLIFFVLLFSDCKKKDSIKVESPKKEILIAYGNLLQSTTSAKSQIIELDYNGDTIRQKESAIPMFNFQRWIINGKIRYSYIEYDSNPKPVQTTFGTVVVTDSELNEIKRIRLAGHEEEKEDTRLDGHEFILLGDDHYIVQKYLKKSVTNIPDSVPHVSTGKIFVPLIQEVQNGAIVFEWDGSNFPELYAASYEGNNFKDDSQVNDYLHLNSMFIDPKDNNLVLSFRNADMIIKINRSSGAIIWKLGGKKSDFPITANQQFLRQHNVTFIDHQTLLVYDNGLAGVRPYTRISEFVLDEVNKTIKSFKTFPFPDNGFANYTGSVQKIGNTYFIGGGTLPKYFEMNATTGQVISEKALISNSYRAYKY